MGVCNSILSTNGMIRNQSNTLNRITGNEELPRDSNMESCATIDPKDKLYSLKSDLSKYSTHTTKQSLPQKNTLIQKSKFSHSSLEEMKICINTQFLIDESNDAPQKKYHIIDKIGRGSFGTVYHAKNLLNSADVAIKKIMKTKDNIIDEMSISNEIDILKRLDHPNILKIFEFYNTSNAYYLINEYCNKGELYSHIKSKLTEYQLSVLFYQIFLGLNYLHQNGVVHRDLKLENILISDVEIDPETSKEYFWIKLIDFGCAKFYNKDKNEKTVVGTSYYMAPEILQHKYNHKCDIWSSGVILYMLITERAPFDGSNDVVIKENISTGKYDQSHPSFLNTSPELQHLVSQLLEMDVNQRLTAKEALSHPWFKIFNGRKLFNSLDKNIYNKQMNNLVHFSLQSKFQQMVLAYLCHNIPSNEETQNIKKLFLRLNSSNNGRLSKEELQKGITPYLGKIKAKSSINDLFLSLDGDNNGFIEYEEFLRATLDKETILKDELLHYAFKFFDKNNTDKISRNQLKQMFKNCNNKKRRTINKICSNTIVENGKNKTGVIDYTDFKQMISNTYSIVL